MTEVIFRFDKNKKKKVEMGKKLAKSGRPLFLGSCNVSIPQKNKTIHMKSFPQARGAAAPSGDGWSPRGGG